VAAPALNNEDFISALRPKFTFGTSFWGLQLLFRRMDLAPVRVPRRYFRD
jgi:hypothetical protein